MEKCECFRLATNYHGDYCAGTKECDPCSCGGDPSKCDFYEDMRKKVNKKMNTLEMMNEADRNSKTYISKKEDIRSMRFNSKLGFHNYEGTPWEGYAFGHLNSLLLIDTWEELPNNIMTKDEAEAKFNIKIVG